MTTTDHTDRHELAVSGMSCGSCVAHVEEALRQVEGVRDVHVDLESGRAIVAGDAIDADALVAAVVEAGYAAERPA